MKVDTGKRERGVLARARLMKTKPLRERRSRERGTLLRGRRRSVRGYCEKLFGLQISAISSTPFSSSARCDGNSLPLEKKKFHFTSEIIAVIYTT